MFISRLSVKNYKSFNEENFIELTQGMNVITGQNNSGKTALLEALSTMFGNHPHRSSQTIRKGQNGVQPLSRVEIHLNSTKGELKRFISERNPNQPFQLRLENGFNPNAQDLNLEQLLNYYFQNEIITQANLSYS